MFKYFTDTPRAAIVEFLRSAEFVSHLSGRALNSLANELKLSYPKGGEVIMRQGEEGDGLYFVMHGRVVSLLDTDEQKAVPLGEIGAGDVFGEMALLTGQRRGATVVATRNCVLLKLDKDVFEQFAKNYPSAALKIAKKCVARLEENSRRPFHRRCKIRAVTLISLTKTLMTMDAIAKTIRKIENSGPVLHLNQNIIEKQLNLKLDMIVHGSEDYMKVIAWTNEQENHYTMIVYDTDNVASVWTRLACRQSDTIYLLAQADDLQETTEAEKFIESHRDDINCRINLVLIHPNRNSLPINTRAWLDLHHVDDFYHIAVDTESDIERLMRIVTGHAVGLVLSGGGARGFAQVGLIRALQECNMPIDIIGGTSAGSIIGGAYASGMGYHDMMQVLKRILIKGAKLDLTFPYLSIAKGRAMLKALQGGLGIDKRIEDQWIRFFCVSSNITKGQVHVHGQGLLWKAVRASVSLPGIYPPFVDEAGLLVDGSLMNDLPVDIMSRQFNAGSVIASLVAVKEEAAPKYQPIEAGSGWSLLASELNPFTKSKSVPRIFDILVRSINVNQKSMQQSMLKAADYPIHFDMNEFGLMEFSAFEAIVEKGYQDAMVQLELDDKKR